MNQLYNGLKIAENLFYIPGLAHYQFLNYFGFLNPYTTHYCRAIKSIALSLVHQKLRTKALVLELLAAICLVKGGHEIILAAFDHLKLEMGEAHRFQTLMMYFANPDSFQIEFMVACMQFINIVVHSVEDMNFRWGT